jgi:OH-DDVA oxygenase
MIDDQRNRAAIEALGDVFAQTGPDIGLIIGNDQMEVFSGHHVPAFAVSWGDYVEGHPRSEEFLSSLPPGIARADLDRTREVYTEWPCHPKLGRHIIESVIAEDFDVAQVTRLPEGQIGSNAAPHAYGFVDRRIMRDLVVPHVPVFVNTFYPPNQPTAPSYNRLYYNGSLLYFDWPGQNAALENLGPARPAR